MLECRNTTSVVIDDEDEGESMLMIDTGGEV